MTSPSSWTCPTEGPDQHSRLWRLPGHHCFLRSLLLQLCGTKWWEDIWHHSVSWFLLLLWSPCWLCCHGRTVHGGGEFLSNSSLLLFHFLAKSLDHSMPVVQTGLAQRIQEAELQARHTQDGRPPEEQSCGWRFGCYKLWRSSPFLWTGQFFKGAIGSSPLRHVQKAKRQAEEWVPWYPWLLRGQEE